MKGNILVVNKKREPNFLSSEERKRKGQTRMMFKKKTIKSIIFRIKEK